MAAPLTCPNATGSGADGREWRRERHLTSDGVNDTARQLGLNKGALRDS